MIRRSVFLVTSFLLVSCSSPASDQAAQPVMEIGRVAKFEFGVAYNQVAVWSDPDTGCQYLMAMEVRGFQMIPRMMPDGKQACPQVAEPEIKG